MLRTPPGTPCPCTGHPPTWQSPPTTHQDREARLGQAAVGHPGLGLWSGPGAMGAHSTRALVSLQPPLPGPVHVPTGLSLSLPTCPHPHLPVLIHTCLSSSPLPVLTPPACPGPHLPVHIPTSLSPSHLSDPIPILPVPVPTYLSSSPPACLCPHLPVHVPTGLSRSPSAYPHPHLPCPCLHLPVPVLILLVLVPTSLSLSPSCLSLSPPPCPHPHPACLHPHVPVLVPTLPVPVAPCLFHLCVFVSPSQSLYLYLHVSLSPSPDVSLSLSTCVSSQLKLLIRGRQPYPKTITGLLPEGAVLCHHQPRSRRGTRSFQGAPS